jgi:hypothetical protein
MAATRQKRRTPATTAVIDTRPIEHWCEWPGCKEWGAHGRHELTRDGWEEHWRCGPHDDLWVAGVRPVVSISAAPRLNDPGQGKLW